MSTGMPSRRRKQILYTGSAMSVRMKDIARDLGVSVVTVSKVLRDHPDVGDDTRERVLARVKELDYRPNLAARSLVTGRTYLVGLVVPDLLHPCLRGNCQVSFRRVAGERLLSYCFFVGGRTRPRRTRDKSVAGAPSRYIDYCLLPFHG